MTILASILGCDLSRVHDEIARVEPYVDGLHFDIADGHFVPNVTFGEPLLRSLETKLPIDVHLMVTNPADHIDAVHQANKQVEAISFHIETDGDPLETIRKIKAHGLRVGIAIKAETSVESLDRVINEVDYVILMTIVTGFSGNPFLSEPLEKIAWIKEKNPNAKVVIDGGVDDQTIGLIRSAGADTVVSGHYLFTAPDTAEAAMKLRE